MRSQAIRVKHPAGETRRQIRARRRALVRRAVIFALSLAFWGPVLYAMVALALSLGAPAPAPSLR